MPLEGWRFSSVYLQFCFRRWSNTTPAMLDSILGANPEIKRAQSRCARALFGVGISANVATILAAIAGIASGIAFVRAHATFAIVALALSAAFDALDGTIARACAAPTPV